MSARYYLEVLVMNRFVVIFISFILCGCYTTMTSVFSSYDLMPRERTERQPTRLFEASPHLALGDNLLVRFNYVPGRSIKPVAETCEQASGDKIDILVYSNEVYSLDLSKVKIRANNQTYYVKSYKTYDTENDKDVKLSPLVAVGFMSSGFFEFKKTVNDDLNEAYRRYIARRGIVAGTAIRFDGKFSCGENFYEMDLFFVGKDSGRQEKYTVYFFPWKSSITPH